MVSADGITLDIEIKRTAPEAGTQFDPYTVKAVAHMRNDSRDVVVIYPGRGGSMDGYEGKYLAMAEALQKRGFNVVRMENPSPREMSEEQYAQFSINNLRAVLDFVCRRRPGVDPVPRVMLMGSSAGASAIAAIASDYPEVENMLLINPSNNVGQKAMQDAIALYRGDLRVLLGSADQIVGTAVGISMHNAAVNARSRAMKIIAGADHQFTGEAHGKIFAQAPLWAFLGRSLEAPDKGLS